MIRVPRTSWIPIGAVTAVLLEGALLLRDFYLNQYEQAWFQFNYPAVYAVLMDPLPFLELAGALTALVVGAVWFNPWTLIHSRRLATTDNAAAQNTHFPAPRTDSEGGNPGSPTPSHAAVVPVETPPAGPTALTLTEKIQKRMSAGPAPVDQPTLPNGVIAGSPKPQAVVTPGSSTNNGNGDSEARFKVETFLGTRRKEFGLEEPEVKLVFNPRKFRYEPSED